MTKIMIMQDNVITQGRYDFSVMEKRVIYLIIREIRDILDGKKDISLLDHNLVVFMDYNVLNKAGDKPNKVYNSLRALRHRDIEINTEDSWLNVGFINMAEHHKKTGKVEIEISKKILPYFVNLAEKYTVYDLMLVITLKKQSSQRLYEHCAQFRSLGWFDISVQNLKEQLFVENKYSRYASFKSRILEPARIELKELYDKGQCDLYFEYSEIKVSRSVKDLKFKVITKESKEREENNKLSLDDMMFHIKSWLDSWLKADDRPKNKEWINKTVRHLNLNAGQIEECHSKLIRIQDKYHQETWAAMARTIITEDFLDPEQQKLGN